MATRKVAVGTKMPKVNMNAFALPVKSSKKAKISKSAGGPKKK